ncbi:MAG TPA: hypothetical protein VGM82_08555 [Gemmatimonadaceae bacterium]|jgi:hypothetical protein
MKTLKLLAALIATALPLVAQAPATATPAAPAAARSSIMVVPYTWKATYWSGYGYGYRDLSEPAFHRTIQGITSLGTFSAIDASAQDAVKAALYDASSGAALNSAVQIEMGKKLAARYILRGSVESVATDEAFEGSKTQYGTRIDVNLEMIDVETGAVALAEKVTSTNGLLPLPAPCQGNRLQKMACEPGRQLSMRTVNSVNAHAKALVPFGSMDSQPHAVMAALDNLSDAVQEFVKKGATSGKIK